MSKSLTKTIARDLDDALENVLHQLRKAGDGVSQEAREAFVEAADRFRDAAESVTVEARRKARRMTKRAMSEVRRHPVEATAVAAGAAALIGLILARALRTAR